MTDQQWIEEASKFATTLLLIIKVYTPLNLDQAKWAIITKDSVTLGRILECCWESVPRKETTHNIPGWDLLCRLTNEYCFGELSEKRGLINN